MLITNQLMPINFAAFSKAFFIQILIHQLLFNNYFPIKSFTLSTKCDTFFFQFLPLIKILVPKTLARKMTLHILSLRILKFKTFMKIKLFESSMEIGSIKKEIYMFLKLLDIKFR